MTEKAKYKSLRKMECESKLILGDSSKELKKISDCSIELTVTSPPYDNLRTYNGSIKYWGENVWKSVIKELYRVTVLGGTVVWVVGDATINGSETGTSFRQALWAKECGFNLHDTMIWYKGRFTAVGALQVRYASVFDYMFIWTKGKIKTFNPLRDRKVKYPGKKLSGTIRNRDGTMRRMSNEGKIIGKGGLGYRFNIWKIHPHSQGPNHPAVFPYQLAYDHILSWSNKGDTVLDPFMGSGTTGIVARDLERNFIGIEVDKNYYEFAKKRISSKG